MKHLVLLMIIISLIACGRRAEEQTKSGSFNVERLFTIDGCTVYRFDDYQKVYFTNCNGSTEWRTSCGKNCTRGQTVD